MEIKIHEKENTKEKKKSHRSIAYSSNEITLNVF